MRWEKIKPSKAALKTGQEGQAGELPQGKRTGRRSLAKYLEEVTGCS